MVGLLARLLRVVAGARYERLPIASAKILIVDEVGHEVLMDALSGTDWKTFLLPIRERTIYWSLNIFWRVLCHLPCYLSGKINIRGMYVLAVADCLGAEILLTFVCNNDWDQGVVGRLAGRRYVAVANGLRNPKAYSGRVFDIYCLWGSYYQKYVTAKRFETIGSLHLGLHLKTGRHKTTAYDIAYVSHFRPWAWYGDSEDSLRAARLQDRALYWLSRYCLKNSCSLAVTLNSSKCGTKDWEDEEKDYLKKFLKCDYTEYYRTHPIMNSYQAILGSDLVITVASSLAVEALACSRKILYITDGQSQTEDGFTIDQLFKYDREWVLCNAEEYRTFEAQLDRIRSTPNSTYMRRAARLRDQFCVEPSELPQDKLKGLLSEILDINSVE